MSSHERETFIVLTELSIDEPLAVPWVRKRPRAIRGRRGGLASMPQMPLDVIFEILGYLRPRDVLSLARTSIEWRDLLMSKTSVRLWKAARENVHGLPDCPSYLSEPAYANLMFMTNCYRCSKPGIRKIVWRHSVRYCPACAKAVVVSWQEEQDFLASVPEFQLVRIVDNRSRPHFEALKAKWFSLPDDAAKAAYLVAQVIEVENILETSMELGLWLEDQGESRRYELENIKETRLEAVKERLRDEGWEEELGVYRDVWLERHKLVRVATKLTERAWAHMRPEIIQQMEKRRAERLSAARRATIRNRVASLFELMEDYTDKGNNCQPQIVDFALMPEFRELLEAQGDVDVDDALSALVSQQIPELASRWRHQRKTELYALVDAARWCNFAIDSDVPGLSVPPISFKCRECDAAPVAWPAILGHACARKRPGGWLTTLPDNSNALEVELQSRCALRAWSAASFTATPIDPCPTLEVLIGLCDLNPQRATRADLDKSPMRFVCQPCLYNKASEGPLTMITWIEAAEHRLRTAADGTACLCDPSNQALAESWFCIEKNDAYGLQRLQELGAMFFSLRHE